MALARACAISAVSLLLGCCTALGAASPPMDDRVVSIALDVLRLRLEVLGDADTRLWVVETQPREDLGARSIVREIFQSGPGASVEVLATACLADAVVRNSERAGTGEHHLDDAPAGWIAADGAEQQCEDINTNGGSSLCAGTVATWWPGYCGAATHYALVVFELSHYTGDPFLKGGYNVAVLLEERDGLWLSAAHWSFGSDSLDADPQPGSSR